MAAIGGPTIGGPISVDLTDAEPGARGTSQSHSFGTASSASPLSPRELLDTVNELRAPLFRGFGASDRRRSDTAGTGPASDGDETGDLVTGILHPHPRTPESSSRFSSSLRKSRRSSFELSKEDIRTIDWLEPYQNAEPEQTNVRKSFMAHLKVLYDNCQGWILLLLVGVIVGLLAALIDVIVDRMSDLRLGYCSSSFLQNRVQCCASYPNFSKCTEWKSWSALVGADPDSSAGTGFDLIFFLGIMLAMTITNAYLVMRLAPMAAGSGLAELKVVLEGFSIKRFLAFKTLLVKAVGVTLSVSSGLIVGKEGPMVHLAACVGNVLCDFFHMYRSDERRKLEILSAASASGVACAFGAPIGGVLFTFEELATFFPPKIMWQTFFCAFFSAFIVRLCNPFHNGSAVMFEVVHKEQWQWFEVPVFMVLGAIGGLLGALFIKANIALNSSRYKELRAKYPVLEATVVTIVTGLVCYWSAFSREHMETLLRLLINDCDVDATVRSEICRQTAPLKPILHLLGTGILFTLLGIWTHGAKIPMGLFIPSLTIGACFGRAVGIIVHVAQKEYPHLAIFRECAETEVTRECVNPGVFAIVGAASMLGGVTHMSVSLVVIMYEITGGVTYILPVLIGIIFSKVSSSAFVDGGMTDFQIRLRMLPALRNALPNRTTGTAGDVMVTQVVDLQAKNQTLKSIREFLEHDRTIRPKGHQGFPVVTEDRRVMGFAFRVQLEELLHKAEAKRLPDWTPVLLDPTGSEPSAPSPSGDPSKADRTPPERPTPPMSLGPNMSVPSGAAVPLAGTPHGLNLSTASHGSSSQRPAPSRRAFNSASMAIPSPSALAASAASNEEEGTRTTSGRFLPARQPNSFSGTPSGTSMRARSSAPHHMVRFDMSSAVDRYPIQIGPEMPLSRVYDMFTSMGLRLCLVTNHGRLVGIIKRKDLASKWRPKRSEADGAGGAATARSGDEIPNSPPADPENPVWEEGYR
eukprot:tig00021357_g20761.t1